MSHINEMTVITQFIRVLASSRREPEKLVTIAYFNKNKEGEDVVWIGSCGASHPRFSPSSVSELHDLANHYLTVSETIQKLGKVIR
tara:strand:- start:64 stop:321 length:258 start_codon:yes stop_codon:yes gene_type:complete